MTHTTVRMVRLYNLVFDCDGNKMLIEHEYSRGKMPYSLKPGFHSNAIACVACI